ncbi:O-antigen ligase family protein [Gelidibacter maritimus]|uniref:O-antigen ligase family protein n=1 Tax=Gelidibacter maritimus TaxID=2761487 RepID=A0A7W2M3B7_9FLAO|nr:O-antigen ligase family protein [Gelidibacter maritimus]MBA6151927.1 O-antigen ligase family protein [Gelidibacter maritimus]
MLRKFLQKRRIIGIWLVVLLISSFSISYALTSISMFAFLPFFFFDTKVNIIEKFKVIRYKRIPIFFIFFFITQLIGLMHSENLDFAQTRVSVMLPILFLPAILSVEKFSKKEFEFIISIAKITVILPFIYYIFVHLYIDNRDISTFVHFTIIEKLDISQFYLIFILFLPILACIDAIIDKRKIMFHIILLCVSFGIIFLMGNKTSLIFGLLLWLIIIFQTYKRKKSKVFVPLIMGAVIFLSAFQLPIIQQRVDVFTKTLDIDLETIITKNAFTITKNTFEHRILINHLALQEISDALPFGVGTGDYREALNDQYKRVNFKAGLSAKYNNHNQYLTEFLKTGILGGFVFLFLMFILIRKINLRQKYYSYYIIFFSMGCMVESYLDRQHGIVIFAFLIPFFLYNDNN